MNKPFTTDLSSVQIWDDLLDDRFILDLDEESNEWNWHLNNIANSYSYPNNQKGSHLIWGATLYDSDNPNLNKISGRLMGLFNFLTDYIIKDQYKIDFIQANGQSIGQNGSTHLDNQFEDNKRTLMVFINSKWQNEWGGNFQLVDQYNDNANVVKNIEYVPGRIVFFDGNIPHRGLAPTKPYVVRKSLVYRLSKYE